MRTPFNARPNLNGNTREDVDEAYTKLSKAQDAIESDQEYLLGNVAHGRNYQHLNDARDALIREYLRGNVRHRRNYQHLDGPRDALIEDRHPIQEKCREAQALLGILQRCASLVGHIAKRYCRRT